MGSETSSTKGYKEKCATTSTSTSKKPLLPASTIKRNTSTTNKHISFPDDDVIWFIIRYGTSKIINF